MAEFAGHNLINYHNANYSCELKSRMPDNIKIIPSCIFTFHDLNCIPT